jgi:hypothetical protein
MAGAHYFVDVSRIGVNERERDALMWNPISRRAKSEANTATSLIAHNELRQK